jgi:phosphopantothenoylcysteine decarboxylase/phosphopantothenate--cysteine ligase
LSPPRPTDSTPPAGAESPLSGREIIIGVCGGIAAYKTAMLVSSLVQQGCGVSVVMTANARQFIGPVTFRALTHRPVYDDLWSAQDSADINHLALSERAELILVAPATANIIGKLANGIADDFLSTLLIGAACPVVLAPAMNTRMWQHPAVQRNLAFLKENGVSTIGPESGRLACDTVGPGRMSEPADLLEAIMTQLAR